MTVEGPLKDIIEWGKKQDEKEKKWEDINVDYEEKRMVGISLYSEREQKWLTYV